MPNEKFLDIYSLVIGIWLEIGNWKLEIPAYGGFGVVKFRQVVRLK